MARDSILSRMMDPTVNQENPVTTGSALYIAESGNRRSEEAHVLDQIRRRQENEERTLAIDEFKKNADRRRLERTKAEQDAQRTVDADPLLTEEYRSKLQKSIDDTKIEHNEALLYNSAKLFTGVRTQQEYERRKRELPYGVLERLNIDKDDKWETAGPKIADWLDVALADESYMKELQKLRMENDARVSAAKASVPQSPLPPEPGRPEVSTNDMIAVDADPALAAAVDPSFWTKITNWEFSSKKENRIYAAELLNRATHRRFIEAENQAKVAQKITGRTVQVNYDIERTKAIRDVQAHLFDGRGDTISYLTPQQANVRKQNIIMDIYNKEIKNPRPIPGYNKPFVSLSADERTEYLEKVYNYRQLLRYENALSENQTSAAMR